MRKALRFSGGGRELKWRETFLVGNFCPFFYAGVGCGLYP